MILIRNLKLFLILIFMNFISAELSYGFIEKTSLLNKDNERIIQIYYPKIIEINDDTKFIIINDGEELFSESDSWHGGAWNIDDSFLELTKQGIDLNLVVIAINSAKRNKGKIIAVTGSSGKTTVKEMLALSLSDSGKIHYSQSSYNNKIGVSLSLARMPSDTDFSIFEVGMNNYGEISYLSKMIKPDIGLINNAGSAHIKYFKSKKEIEKEKLELIHGLNSGGSLILNEDISINKSIKNFSKKNNIELIKFGQKDKSNNFLINYKYFPDGSLIEANFDTISLSFKMFAPGLHMALNAIAVLSVCNILDLPLGFIIKKLTNFNPVEGRGLTYDLSFQNKKIKIIDESFNANPESMISSINLLNDMDAFENKRKILILGDMLELGKFSREYHIKTARFINKTNINLVFCSGKRMKYLWDNLSKNKKGAFAENPEELIKPLTEKIINKDIFLLKGSSNSKIKIILSYLNNENLIREIA